MDALAGLSFAVPARLWMLVTVPLVLFALLSRERWRRRESERFASERIRGLSNGIRSARAWLIPSAWLLAIIAAAGPRLGEEVVPLPTLETSTIYIVDLSQSMAARDVGASRLSAAKAIIRNLVDADPGGKVGLVAFEGTAEAMSPLTTDHSAVITLLDSLSIGELAEAGSNLAAALRVALELSEGIPGKNVEMVLLSDGEGRGESFEDELAILRTRSIRVHAVVLGTEEGSTIPTEQGKPLEDPRGETVITRADPRHLSTIAGETGGQLFSNPFDARALARISRDVELSASGEDRGFQRVPIERYQWPFGAAVMLFLFSLFLNRGAE